MGGTFGPPRSDAKRLRRRLDCVENCAPRGRAIALRSVSMSEARQRLGRAAETLVADALESRGMRIVARNERTSGVRGEIDLIALDGPALVFVEVKALRATSLGGPERPAIAVGHRKQQKLRSLALAWLNDHD